MPRITLDGWGCLRCNHEWVPREEEQPKVCPKCKSPYWNTPRRSELKQAEESLKNRRRNANN